jgi:hypothetical protein
MPLEGCERLALCDGHLRARIRSEMGLSPEWQTYGGRPEFKRLSESMERPVYDRRPSARLEADAAQANNMQQMRDKADASERIDVHGAPPLGQNTSREAADNLAGQGKTLVDALWLEEHGE